MTEILTRAPIWVWPLLIVLMIVGFRAMKDRATPLAVIVAMPLLGLMGVRSIAALSPPHWVWGAFVAIWLSSVAIGYARSLNWVISRDGHMVRVRGEIWTFIAMMVIFWANFAVGFLQAVAPNAINSGIGVCIFACTLAVASGQFAGRALRVLRTKRSPT